VQNQQVFSSPFDLPAHEIAPDLLHEIISRIKDKKRARTPNEPRQILRGNLQLRQENELITRNPADKRPLFVACEFSYGARSRKSRTEGSFAFLKKHHVPC
jgi:hypothetical protein